MEEKKSQWQCEFVFCMRQRKRNTFVFVIISCCTLMIRNLLRLKTNFILLKIITCFGISTVPRGSKHSTHLKFCSSECAFLFCKWCTKYSHTCMCTLRENTSEKASALNLLNWVCLCIFCIMDTIKIFHRITQLFNLLVLPHKNKQIHTCTPIPCIKILIHTQRESTLTPFGH